MSLVADRVATHTVYWLTAAPLIDHRTLRTWREDWGRRFFRGPTMTLPDEYADDSVAQRLFAAVLRCRRDYVLGGFWLLFAMILPVILIILITRRPNPSTVGLMITLGVFQLLLLAAVFRNEACLKGIVRSWRALARWLHFGTGDPMPSWVFSSPCGPRWQRLLMMAVACALVSTALSHLVCGSMLRIVKTPVDPPARQAAESLLDRAAEAGFRGAATDPRSVSLTDWLLLASAALAAALFSPAIVILAVLTEVGPALSAYVDALNYSGE